MNYTARSSMAANMTQDSFYQSANSFWDYIWESRDKRMDSYFLMGSPLPTLVFCFLYVISSVWVGPWIMRDREPFQLRGLIIFYNFFMAIVNAIGHYLTWQMGWGTGYSFRCEPVDFSMNPKAVWVSQLCYLFYLSKFVDWVDTLLFTLTKKFSHVSGLHVYHHFIMPINVWPIVRFVPGGHVTLGGLLNTFVHTIMYTYYGLSALGPQWKKYLWWKKYITAMQMIQFLIGMVHMPQAYFFDCGFPRPFMYYIVPQGFIFLALFGNFYIHEYRKKPLQAKKHAE